MKRLKRKKLRLKRISLLFGIILLIGIVLFVIPKREVKKNVKEVPKEPVIKEEKEKVYTLKVAAAGDALIHDRLYNEAWNGTGYDFKPYLRLIKEYIKDYDLKYYNQETILGGTSIGLSSYPSFNSPQEVGDAMIDCGFNIVSLATNHTLDRGETAVLKSREYWNSKTGVYAIGSYSSFDEKKELESKIFTVNNIKYAILNYTYGTNGIPVPYGKDYLVNLWDDTNNYEGYKNQVLNDINNLRDKVDVLMVAMHWGREYIHTPTELVKSTAQFLADNGVDVIIGTHSHTVQPTEWIGNTLVMYSLGNFISAQNSESCTNYKCNIGLINSFNITKTVKDGKESIKIDNVKNELIYTYHNNYHNYLVIPFSNEEIKSHLDNYMGVYTEYSNLIKSQSEDIKIAPVVN